MKHEYNYTDFRTALLQGLRHSCKSIWEIDIMIILIHTRIVYGRIIENLS